MSADNIIYVKKEKSFWWVWHDSASNDSPNPEHGDNTEKFKNKGKALKYAVKLQHEIGYVEYGIHSFYV